MALLRLTPAEERALQEMIRSHRSASEIARAKALLDIGAGESPETICRRTGWKIGTVYRWLFEYTSHRRGNQAAVVAANRYASALRPLHELAIGARSPASRPQKAPVRHRPHPAGPHQGPRGDGEGRSWKG